jgi:hypothetical protein
LGSFNYQLNEHCNDGKLHDGPGFTTEVQTDSKQAASSRPASAMGGSYFNKLLLNCASKQAGGVACAGV